MITHEVIKKAQQGDSEAFTRIYNETIKTAYYVAKRILLDEQAVEDVLQESYMAVYEHLGDYKAGNFQGWVDTIVANRTKNYLRKKNPILFSQMETDDNINIEFEEEKIEFRPDEKVDYDETKRLIMEIVDGLSDEQRLAVILFYFEQRSVKEISEICECSENTVKSRLNYARKKIKEDVLELEKKGTKLYSISVLPFLYWLFREEFLACEVPVSTTTNVAHATGKAIERATGKTSSLSSAGRKATETVAKAVVEETVKTGMALGTKIAIGIAVATISVGGITLGSILLKDNTPSTEQSSEKDTPQDSENEQETEQDTEETTELTKEEIDVIVNDFLLSYQPAEQIEKYGFILHPWEDPYATSYFYTWCNDIPLVVTAVYYIEENQQAEMINYFIYSVDKSTGEIIEIQNPDFMIEPENSYPFFVGKTDVIIGKSSDGECYAYCRVDYSINGFVEREIANEDAEALIDKGEYQQITWSYLAELTENGNRDNGVTTEEIDKGVIQEFLQNYEPNETLDVYELRGEPRTTNYYKEHLGLQYVTFIADEKNILVLSIPYGSKDTDDYVYNNLEFYYYDDAIKSFVEFTNPPELAYDELGSPSGYGYEVWANTDGGTNYFCLYNGYVRIGVEVSGTTLVWEMGSTLSGVPLEWQK